MSLRNSALVLLLKEAREREKRYEWLQAAEFYGKAADLALKKKDFLSVAEYEERIGFCFYRAAFQAGTNVEFKRLLKRAIQAYKRKSELLEKVKEENNQAKIDHAHALIAYTSSWLETKPSKKKELTYEWWNLEKQALKAYEASGDSYSAGRTCNNMIEWSIYERGFLFKKRSERKKILKESIYLGDKAIQAFSKLDDRYELARAYCFASGCYVGFSEFFADENKIMQLVEKCQDYVNKALELSRKIGDAWLIGMSYYIAWVAATFLKLDPVSAMEIAENILKFGKIAKDNYLIGRGKNLTSFSAREIAVNLEDPGKQREGLKKAVKLAREAKQNFQIINHAVGLTHSILCHGLALNFLASIETDLKTKQELLEMTGKVIQEEIKRKLEVGAKHTDLYFNLAMNLSLLSATKTDIKEKRDLLQKAQYYTKKLWIKSEDGKYEPKLIVGYFQLSRLQGLLAKLETNNTEKIKLLKKAVSSIEKYIKPMEKKKKIYTQTAFGRSFHFGNGYNWLGGFLQQIYSVTKEEKTLCRAIEAYKKAAAFHESADLPTRAAESCWRVAQLLDLQGERQKASQNYEYAAEVYDLASKKIPQLKEFYNNYSVYMRAWSHIEQARYAHSIEDYVKAEEHYEKAAKIHESAEPWSYLASNYLAWANMEEAEGLSRRENTEQAKQTFQEALQQFTKAEKSIKQELERITSADEKEITQKLFKASDLRRKYCHARILVEDAKLLDREGKYLQSSRSYGEAAKNISTIIDKMDVEAERKELKYLAILCQAWEKMAVAEETTSSGAYLEAAQFFEKAKDHCYTRRASLWAMGNSSFCKGLAAGTKYQDSMDLKENAKAKRYMKTAASNYLQGGFKTASEYAKATQRLFDAYVFINQTESEVDPERKAKQYQMAESLLELSAGSFMKAKQPEKTAQVEQLLSTVREEKALAVSLAEVLHAPTITSSTASFTAPTASKEISAGLENFEHANVQANLVVGLKEVRVGESFCLSVEFVNAGKEPALLTKVENFVPQGFVVVKKPEIYRLEESCLNMKGKQIAPLKLVEAKLVLQPSKKGVYNVKPRVHYLDELGQNKVLQLKSVEVNVEEVILADRVSTGTKELDCLLLGGFPKEYAVVLTGSPSDEREMLIKNFLETGIEKGGTSFYVTTEASGLDSLLDKSGFFLFLCNLRPKIEVPDLPNVYKLHGKTDLNNLGIALVKAYRRLSQKPELSKRVCVQILSDVLVNYGSKTTRKWISELITDMGSRGFTLLAVLDSSMHPVDQANAVLNLFDGEISLTQREDTLEGKSVVVRKLRNQDYIKNSICLKILVQQ